MSKFGAFLARKPALPDIVIEPAGEPEAQPADNPLELDEELFTAMGAQTGAEHEALRTLLLDASAKAGELDTIKDAIDRLVDPVSKTLRAIEAERAEKFALQTVLNKTRTAYGKLRNEAVECETRLAASLRECEDLRRELANAQTLLRSAEAPKAPAEVSIDAVARRAQIAELESRLAQESGESKALRAEKRRLEERLATAEKRIIALESDFDAARQRLLMAEDEKRTQQELLDKAGAETVRLSRKLAESQADLDAQQGRLRHLEANIADLTNERARLAGALDDANERHANEHTNQRTRFEALMARAEATDKLLNETRNNLIARTEEIRDYDACVSELAQERDALQKRLADMQAERRQYESALDELDEANTALTARCEALNRAFTAKEVALERAEESNDALKGRVKTLEQTLAADEQNAAQSIEELNAALRREKLEHAVSVGALETARHELARAMRALMTFERQQTAQETAAQPRAANAA